MRDKCIAIDGPSGAGKSTIARTVAKEFGYIYVDTGAIYRCLGLYVLRKGIGSKDIEKVISILPEVDIELKYDDTGLQHMFLNGDDVTGLIRTPEVSMYASDVSAIPEVRAFLLDMQRSMADKYNVIMDGRDIGTVVVPDAGIKIFLTADPKDRAMRRFLELKEKNPDTQFEDVYNDLIKRDENDSSRKSAPLKPAEDAILLDTTGNTLQQSLDLIFDLIKEKLEK